VNENTEEIPPEFLENEHLREAVGYMEKAAYTKEQLTAYDKWKVDLMTARSMLDDAEAIGEAIGLEKGEAIGLEKGKAIGLEKGEAIGGQKKAVIIAQNLLKIGMSIDDVVGATGLSKQQVGELPF
jgi:predicted transposase YdaD